MLDNEINDRRIKCYSYKNQNTDQKESNKEDQVSDEKSKLIS